MRRASSSLLWSALITAEVFTLTWLLITEDLTAVLLLVLGTTAAIVLAAISGSNWPFGAVLMLVAASAGPRFAGTLFHLHVRPEHVAIGFALLAVILHGLRGRLRAALQVFDYLLITYVLLNFLTSAVMSPEPRMTLRWAALNAIVTSPYFLMRALLRDHASLYRAFNILLWAGAIESTYGIVCFVSNHVLKTTFGVTPEQYGAAPGVYGTQFEANLFGSYSACCAVMFLTFYLLNRENRRVHYAFGFAVTAAATVISLARSALVALLLVTLLVLLVTLMEGHFRIRRLVPVAIGAGVLAAVFSPLLVKFVQERFSTIDFSDLTSDPTTVTRVVGVMGATQDIRLHPVWGTGTDSFQLFFDWNDYLPGSGLDEPGWIGNSPLRILHDTGLVGLAVFVTFLVSLARATRRAMKVAEPQTKTVLAALSFGALVYLITFQATEATMLAFTWVHLGLLGAGDEVTRMRYSLTQS